MVELVCGWRVGQTPGVSEHVLLGAIVQGAALTLVRQMYGRPPNETQKLPHQLESSISLA